MRRWRGEGGEGRWRCEGGEGRSEMSTSVLGQSVVVPVEIKKKIGPCYIHMHPM